MREKIRKRNAHLGLVAAAMLLIGCLSVLVVQDRDLGANINSGSGDQKVLNHSNTVSSIAPKF